MRLSSGVRSVLESAHGLKRASQGQSSRATTGPTATHQVQPSAIKLSSSLASPGPLATTGAPESNSAPARPPNWRKIDMWKQTSEADFLRYRWQVANTIDRKSKLVDFLTSVLPNKIPPSRMTSNAALPKTRDDFVKDVEKGIKMAPMAVRLTPYTLSVADWSDPLNDPIRRQFVPLASTMIPDHPKVGLDSLHEEEMSPVEGLVHRYPDKVLFLATSVCPVYCRFCTRSYAVGSPTESVHKKSRKPMPKRWNKMFEYIEAIPSVQDVVVSGGDAYYLEPHNLRMLGERLLAIPHIKRFRLASKGLAVCPSRVHDDSDDWSQTLVDLSDRGRSMGKQVALHTHFNHPNEITWITEAAARHLFKHGVIVRNQSVVLRGVNDDVATMSSLIRKLAELNIEPYYVYQADMVKGVEELRTPLSSILDLEKHIRGTIAGFMMPDFVVDLPGGGGKRLANSFESYDRHSGLSTWKAPGVADPDKVFEYYDPIDRSG